VASKVHLESTASAISKPSDWLPMGAMGLIPTPSALCL
jgi:hypothetical protein